MEGPIYNPADVEKNGYPDGGFPDQNKTNIKLPLEPNGDPGEGSLNASEQKNEQ